MMSEGNGASALAISDGVGAATLEQVVVGNDLSKLNPGQRLEYYSGLCRSLGLNPLTRPFQYIVLNGKLTLYATRDATDQLRKGNEISISIAAREMIGDIYVVTARATDQRGRTDESTGAVTVSNLRGEAMANALMKAETKAKRRVTLSICGLGMSDETEVETIPGAARVEVDDSGHVAGHPALSAPAFGPNEAGAWFKSIGGTKDQFGDYRCATWVDDFKSAQDVGVRTVDQLHAFLRHGEKPSAHEAFNPFEDDGQENSSAGSKPAPTSEHSQGVATDEAESPKVDEADEEAKIASAIRPYEVSTSEGRKLRAAAKRMGKNLAVEAAKCRTKTFDALMVALDPDYKPGEKTAPVEVPE